MKSARELIAVYGSLLRAEGRLLALGAATSLEYLGPARLPGELFDLGDYPGLCWDGQLDANLPAVAGELFAILEPGVLAILDDYEGCGIESARPPHIAIGFRRQRVALLEPAAEAWVYLYHGSVEGCPQVSGKAWPDYKRLRVGQGS